MAISLECDSVMRGYYIYKEIWEVSHGEIFHCMRETGNRFDPFAVAVISEDDEIIGHVPKLISAAASLFLRYSGSIKCKVTGSKAITRCAEYQCKIKFSWMQRPHEIHKNLNPMKITTHTVVCSHSLHYSADINEVI